MIEFPLNTLYSSLETVLTNPLLVSFCATKLSPSLAPFKVSWLVTSPRLTGLKISSNDFFNHSPPLASNSSSSF